MKMNKNEASILTYLETCLVDSAGKIVSARMNAEDWAIMEKWKDKGLIDFGRRPFKDIPNTRTASTHWVRFSESAYRLAYKCRQERAERHTPTLKEVPKHKCCTDSDDDRSLEGWANIILETPK